MEKVALEVGTHFNQINSKAYKDHLSLLKNTEKDSDFDLDDAMNNHKPIGDGFEKPVLLDVFDCYSILHQLSVFTFFDAGLIHQRFNGLPRFTNSRDDRYNVCPCSESFRDQLCAFDTRMAVMKQLEHQMHGKCSKKKNPLSCRNVALANERFVAHVNSKKETCYIHYLINAYLVEFYPPKGVASA